jgi:hypothetical protein
VADDQPAKEQCCVTGFVKVLINGGEEFCDEGGVSGFPFPIDAIGSPGEPCAQSSRWTAKSAADAMTT